MISMTINQARNCISVSTANTAIHEKTATVISFFPQNVKATATANAAAAEITEEVE